MVFTFFDKERESTLIGTNKVGASVNEQIAQELHKLVIQSVERRKVYARFKYKYLGSRFS